MKKKFLSLLLTVVMLASTLCLFAYAEDGMDMQKINDKHTDSYLFGFNEPKEFDGTKGSAIDFSDKLADIKELESFTVICQFMQTADKNASLFSVSNSSSAADYFHIYAKGKRLGFEFHTKNGTDLSFYDLNLNDFGVNTVAFVADAESHVFKLYLNGLMVVSFKFDQKKYIYECLSDIPGIDSILVGATKHSSGGYPLTGTIGEIAVYGEALPHEDIVSYTSATPSSTHAYGAGQPFVYGDDFGISGFRIPCLLTLENGDVLAVSDLRANLADSPNNIEIGVRILEKKTGAWSEGIIVNEFDDYEYNYASKDSASFIDAAVVQLESGRILMLTDVMPANCGGGVGGKGNGMRNIEGEWCVVLTKGDPTEPSVLFEYYLYPNKNSTAKHDKYLIKKVSDNSETGYTTDAKFYIYQNGKALTVKQQPNNTKNVPMNIFYSSSLFKVYRTSYFYLNYSDDGGYTWSDPQLVGSEYRLDYETCFNKSPGVGIQLKNGEYSGRVLFPVYVGGSGSAVTTRMLYSDDGGDTWQMGGRAPLDNVNSPSTASETQIVELPDGTVRMYTRTNTKYIAYADSTDGGVTFGSVKQDFDLSYCGDCMVSVINLEQKIDGKDAIAISFPAGGEGLAGRANGIIKIGLIEENEGFDAPAHDRYSVDWKYTYSVNNSEFWYSCLAEKEDSVLAILYEPGPLVYEEISISDITKISNKIEPAVTDISVTHADSMCQDGTLTLKLTLNKPIFEKYSALSGEAAYATAASTGEKYPLTFSGLENDNMTVCFSGTASIEIENESFTFSLAEGSKLATEDGIFDTSALTFPEATVSAHGSTAISGEKKAGFFSSGYTGDTVCENCQKALSIGEKLSATIAKPASIVVMAVAVACIAGAAVFIIYKTNAKKKKGAGTNELSE